MQQRRPLELAAGGARGLRMPTVVLSSRILHVPMSVQIDYEDRPDIKYQ